MIEVEGPDGAVVEFPDGTDRQTIKGVMRKRYGGPKQAKGRGFLGTAADMAQQFNPVSGDMPFGLPIPNVQELPGTLDKLTQGATMGFGDNLTAAEHALRQEASAAMGGSAEPGLSVGERYDQNLAAEQQQQAQFAEGSPVISTVAELAGAGATTGGLARQGLTLMGRGSTRAGNVGLASAEGGAYGSVAGAGYNDENPAEGAAFGAATGAFVGGTLTAAGQKIGQLFAQRAFRKNAPTTEELREGSERAFSAASQRNPRFHSFDQFTETAKRVLNEEGYHPTLHPKVRVALREFERTGETPDFKTIQKLRRIAKNASDNFNNPSEQRLGIALEEALDGYVEMISPVPEVRQGRQLWSRYRRSQMIDEALEKAARRAASTGSGGNIENTIRQNIRQILDNPKKRRGFSKPEVEAMEKLVRGGKVQNFLRLVGKLSPSGNGLMAYLSGYGAPMAGFAAGGPAGAAAGTVLPIAGGIAKPLAQRGTMGQANMLEALVHSGGQLPGPRQQGQIENALVRALAAQSGAKVSGP